MQNHNNKGFDIALVVSGTCFYGVTNAGNTNARIENPRKQG
jgi:hypothetical protein